MTDWRLRSRGEPSRWQWERSRPDSPEHPPIARRLKEEGVRPPEDLTTKRGAPIIAKSAAPEEIIKALALLVHAGDGSKRCALVRDRPTRTAMQWPSSKPASWAPAPQRAHRQARYQPKSALSRHARQRAWEVRRSQSCSRACWHTSIRHDRRDEDTIGAMQRLSDLGRPTSGRCRAI
jgi:hypothetical protein